MNTDRFFDNLHNFARIGYEEGQGTTRLAFSDEYYHAIAKMKDYAASKGFECKIDKIGNIFVIYNPKGADKFLMIGSHMDTVKSGGLYDGAMGAMAALEVLETFKDKNIEPNIGLVSVGFNAEEGSEMGGTFGSRTISGRNDLEDPSLEAKLATYDLSLSDLKESVIDREKLVGFVELHIEQGAVLESENIDIGLVNGIVGITRYNLFIKGESNHAGTTPMDMRNDPVRCLPDVLDKLFELSSRFAHPFVMTVGDMRLRPGAYNIIANEAEILIELRDMDQGNIDEFIDDLNKYLEDNVKDYRLVKNIKKPPVYLDKDYMEKTRAACQSLGYTCKEMSSGAGHDAQEMSHHFPTGLIFIPSVGGISHSPREYSTDDQVIKGLNVLYHTVESIVGEY